MNRAFVLSACVLSACAMAWGKEAEYESFEDRVPPYFVATRAASLSISPWHSKQGKNSLRWDWLQGEELVIRHGIGDVSRGHGSASFSVWLYMEAPIAGALAFEFRQGEKVAGSFRFPLEFTGWRQGRPLYHVLLGSKPTTTVDNIRIAAPTAVAKGTVFLDFIKYNTLTHGARGIYPEKEAQWRRPVPDERRFPKPDRLTEAERSGIRELIGHKEGPGVGPNRMKGLFDEVKALGIVRDEHGMRGGPSIDRLYQHYGPDYWPDEHGPGWLGIQDPRPITRLAYRVADAYSGSRDAEQRRRLAEAFLLIEDHLYDQGLQAAAGFHCNWHRLGMWSDAVFLMRDVLAKAGRLQRQCDYYLWNWRGGEIFDDADPRSHMDFYLLDVPRLLRACLMQVEPAEQVRWLRAFKGMLERSMLQPASALKLTAARTITGSTTSVMLAIPSPSWRKPSGCSVTRPGG